MGNKFFNRCNLRTKIKKLITMLIVSSCFCTTVLAAQYVVMDNKQYPIEVKVINETSYVPLRQMGKILGLETSYNSMGYIKLYNKEGTDSLALILNTSWAKKNNAEFVNKFKPKVVEGTVYVPLRFISENFNYDVDSVNGMISLTKKEAPQAVVLDTAPPVPPKEKGNEVLEEEKKSEVLKEEKQEAAEAELTVEETASSIGKYLRKNYSVCETEIGEIDVNFKIREKILFSQCYDFDIQASLGRSWYRCRAKADSQSDIDEAESQLKEHMRKIGEDLSEKLPNTRLMGEYDSSYYTYPNLRVDYHLIQYCQWQNFGCGSLCGAKEEPSGFRWLEYSKDIE